MERKFTFFIYNVGVVWYNSIKKRNMEGVT